LQVSYDHTDHFELLVLIIEYVFSAPST